MNLQPPAVLNMGAPGSGKTYALITLLKSGLKVFIICTEPDGLSSLLDACAAERIPLTNLHWTVCQPTSAGWGALKEMAKTISDLGYEDITKIKSGVGKGQTRDAAMKFLSSCENFTCERTGINFGDITQLGDDCAIVLDSLSGLNTIAMMAAQGYKPAAHQGEWGVAMNFIENLILKLTSDRKAFFILNAHVEKEENLISGASQIMASTLGRKVAPKLPRFFSEVIYSKRTVNDNNTPIFLWSTADKQADLKNRTLPVATALIQDYAPIVEGYRKRKAAATPPTAAPKQPEAPLSGLVPPAAPMKPQAA
jgi:hypothetical protein